MNGAGNRYTFLYDANGQKTVQIDPLHRRTTSMYDAAGSQSVRIDAKNQRTSYVYSETSQLTGRHYPDGSRATFAYDDDGRRILAANETISTTFAYDATGRKSSVTSDMNGAKKTIDYAYDAAGNRSLMIDPEGGRVTYSYSAANQLTSLQNGQGERTSFAYDARGGRTLKQLANGTRASYSYDPNGNTTQVANLKSDNAVISSFDYQYDAIDSRISIAENDGSRTTYPYDAANQFTEEHRTGTNPYRNTFTYDAAENRTLKNEDGTRTTYSYDAANQLTTSLDSTGTTTYTFDANGNQHLVEAPNGDRTTTTWDYENRTTLVELPSGIRNTMAYEPDGLRVKLEESTGTKIFTWDGQVYLSESDETNSTNVTYTNEPTTYGNLISQYRKTGAIWIPSYYHQDALGSTKQLTSASAEVTNTYQYNAWGVVLTSTGTTVNLFQFTGNVGYYLDPDTNNQYIRARIYSPLIGNWLSVDPIGFVDGMNLFFSYFLPGDVDPSGFGIFQVSACCKFQRPCCGLTGTTYVDYKDVTVTRKLVKDADGKWILESPGAVCKRNAPISRTLYCGKFTFTSSAIGACGTVFPCTKQLNRYLDALGRLRDPKHDGVYRYCVKYCDCIMAVSPEKFKYDTCSETLCGHGGEK